MKKEIPIYEISIDLLDEETTVSFNSLVSMPAHEKNFMTFAKQKAFEFNDEEQVITGLAISADTPIYRFDQETGEEYYVVFTKQAIKDIIFDYARKDNFNNVNLEHNPNRIVKSIFMIHSYQIDADDGSWIVSYKVTDKELFDKAKNGEFNGFSIEGVFNLIDTKEEHEMSKIYDELLQFYLIDLKKKKI